MCFKTTQIAGTVLHEVLHLGSIGPIYTGSQIQPESDLCHNPICLNMPHDHFHGFKPDVAQI